MTVDNWHCHYEIQPVYSEIGQGWYADVIDAETGDTIHTTGVYSTRHAAEHSARQWIVGSQEEHIRVGT